MIVPAFGLGQKSKSVNVTAQTHKNVYADLSPSPDKTPLAFYGTPGLRLFVAFGDTPVRGMKAVNDLLYVVHRGTFYAVNNAGVKTIIGTIGSTTGRVQIEYNGLQIGVVDGLHLYIYNIDRTSHAISTLTHVGTSATLVTAEPHNRYTGETIIETGALPAAYNGTFLITVVNPTTLTYTMLSDPGANAAPSGAYVVDSSFVVVTSELFANPADITWLKHTFIYDFRSSGVFQISAIDDGTQADGLDFATAESNPDNLVHVIADHGELVLFNESTVEFWSNNGNSDFPFSNQPGSEVEYGLVARWSMVKFNDSLAGLMTSADMGQVQVMMLKGHAPVPISTPAMDTIINAYPSVADATAFAYMLGGHPMYQINFPTAGKSWLYDALTGLWSSMESGLNGGRHRAEISTNYLNKIRVSDYENGNIYTLDPDALTDNGMQRPYEITSRHVFMNLEPFRMGWLQLDFETGVGIANGQGSDPQVMLQVSRDGGGSFGNEMWRPLGKMGERRKRIFFRRLGRGCDFVFRLRVTDSVKFALAGAAITDEQ